jgi:uncharacterized heparinase superfamily protein
VGGGCLAFEFSTGVQRIVVNCGLPRNPGDDLVQAARATAAYSTASLDGVPSTRILAPRGSWLRRRAAAWLIRRLGPVALSGPETVSAERSEREHAPALVARHDGYKRDFGIIHERHWRLAAGGERLEGEDIFRFDGAPGAEEAVIRFHLASGIKASRTQAGRAVMLVLPNREAWQFEVHPAEARVEESMFFAAPDGARRTEQIVVAVKLAEAHHVRWRFDRLARAAGPGRRDEAAQGLL